METFYIILLYSTYVCMYVYFVYLTLATHSTYWTNIAVATGILYIFDSFIFVSVVGNIKLNVAKLSSSLYMYYISALLVLTVYLWGYHITYPFSWNASALCCPEAPIDMIVIL